jgi:hypothetical protein
VDMPSRTVSRCVEERGNPGEEASMLLHASVNVHSHHHMYLYGCVADGTCALRAGNMSFHQMASRTP